MSSIENKALKDIVDLYSLLRERKDQTYIWQIFQTRHNFIIGQSRFLVIEINSFRSISEIEKRSAIRMSNFH